MIKGKILLIVSALIALVLTAFSAAVGYFVGIAAIEAAGNFLAAYDLSMLPTIIAAVFGGITFLVCLPCVITARQVCRMYNVSRKYAKWSPVTIVVALLMLLLTAAGIVGIHYMLHSNLVSGLVAMGNMFLAEQGMMIDIQMLQISMSASLAVTALLLFIPLLVALRGRDGVSALLKKKRAHSSASEE